ncbi:SRPBCC family protein [Chondromyces crocatus]|uniref:Activator of Hsp90 ATPase homologue 1/2-like C-terminal domain-containing protein n=1 Tax=Chondromyces crocatus TaxID=52 RepID=A0A0K1ENT5_CHOCO|nr:SRPBCC domain-containing protein [Chondromyces crocatus]AKT42489.1 uncharacterized protein CMC5_067150 [Chondromyces crocatus]
MKKPEHLFAMVRTIDASPEAVYAAWTQPEIMRRWFATVVEADVRVGGRYRIENHETDGTVNVHAGEYLVLEPGRRIVMTFQHVGATPNTDYFDEFVSVTLRPLPSGMTELTLENGWDGLGPGDDGLEALKQGWGEWLDLLAAVL